LGKIDNVRNYLKCNLSLKRYEHSLGVEQTSLIVAENFGIDKELCALAGLSHDICREMSFFDLTELSGIENENPILLHGHAGAVFLRSKFNIQNESVLNAVKYHTSGSYDLDDVGKVIFAADYLEPGRTHLGKGEMQRLFLLELNDMVLEIASKTKQFLEIKGFTIEANLNNMIRELSKDNI